MISLEIGKASEDAAGHTMNLLEFIAEMTQSLAWPLAVIVIVLMFHKQLQKRIEDLSKFSFPGGAAEFDKQANEVKSSLASAAAAQGGIGTVAEAGERLAVAALTTTASDTSTAQGNADGFTHVGRIVATWNQIEDIVRKRLKDAGAHAGDLRGISLLTEAKSAGLLTEDQFNSLRGLNAMRNLAAHGQAGDVTEKRVTEFVVLANAIETVLSMTAPKAKPDAME